MTSTPTERRTLKVEVELTIEAPKTRHYTDYDLADDIRDDVFKAIQNNAPYTLIAMTCTGVSTT